MIRRPLIFRVRTPKADHDSENWPYGVWSKLAMSVLFGEGEVRILYVPTLDSGTKKTGPDICMRLALEWLRD